MAQTTAALSRSNYKVEVSTNGSSWTDISGQGATVVPSGGDQIIGEQNTADGNAPVVTGSNKTASRTWTISALYTETAGEAWEVVSARWLGATKTIYARYSPDGGDSGDALFTAVDDAGSAFACPIQNCLTPEVDAGSGDPAMFTFAITVPDVAESTIA